eukprot:jgi/Chlat1/2711/Chrsp180S00192
MFVCRLTQRSAPHQLDPLAQAFLPVAGELLAAAYNAPTLGGEEDDTRSRLHQILRFWGDQHVFDMETIARLERQMLMGGVGTDIAPSAGGGYPPHPLQQSGGYPPPPVPSYPPPPPSTSFTPPPLMASFMAAPTTRPPAVQSNSSGGPYGWDTQQTHQQQLMVMPQMAPEQQTQHQHVLFAPMPTTAHPSTLLQAPVPEKAETSPAFPPGLLPSLVRAARSKLAPPYSPISPLDIPSSLPLLPTQPDAYLKGRLEQFYKEIDRYDHEDRREDDSDNNSYQGTRRGDGSGGYEPGHHRGEAYKGLGASYEYEGDGRGEGGGDDFAVYRRSRSKDYHGAYEERGRGR